MQLSVIIVNYNVRSFLENALLSIQKAMQNINGEIFVVDNASHDGSVEMLQNKFPEVNIIINNRNVGFAAANNIALKKAQGKYLVLINPDTVVQEDTFLSLIDFFENNSQIGLAGCKILNPDGTLQLACRRSIPTPWSAFAKVTGLSSIFPKTKFFGKYNLTYLNPEDSYEVEAVSGSFMFLRKKVYDEVGNLDESYFMYGEDLDWCYRILKSGWKIFYFNKTQIIHFKGESTKQSNIDDIRMFYDAMHIFVRKNISRSGSFLFLLQLGIIFKSWIAWSKRLIKSSLFPLTDWIFILLSITISFYFRFDHIVKIPNYAIIPIIFVPALITLATIYFSGGYTKHRYSISRTILAVIISYVIISALTYFFRQFGFSRIIIAYSAIFSLIALSGWRFLLILLMRYGKLGKGGIFGRRTLIVGVTQSGLQLLNKLRHRVNDGYDVVGFIDLTRRRIGEKISGVEIVGSIDNIGKVIIENKISDVIFSTDSLSYKDILSIISKTKKREINYRMVPNSLEVIIGKTHIDHLNDFPLIDIEYKLDSRLNQFIKRIFDIVTASILLVIFLPFKKAIKKNIHYNLLIKVLSGKYSIVGYPAEITEERINVDTDNYFIKPGLTGLVQINKREDITLEEIEKYNVFYAKNYSLLLDIEVVIKTIISSLKN